MELTRKKRLFALAVGMLTVATVTVLSITILPQVAAQSGADECNVTGVSDLTVGELSALTVEDAICGLASDAYDDFIAKLGERADALVERGRLTAAQADEFNDWLDDVPAALSPANLVANLLARVDDMTLDELGDAGGLGLLGGFGGGFGRGFGFDDSKGLRRGFGPAGVARADFITPAYCEDNPDACSFRDFVPEPSGDDADFGGLGALFSDGVASADVFAAIDCDEHPELCLFRDFTPEPSGADADLADLAAGFFGSFGALETGAPFTSLFGDFSDVVVIDCTENPDECERVDDIEAPFNGFGSRFGRAFGGELPFGDGDVATAIDSIFCADNPDDCDFSEVIEELIDDLPPFPQTLTDIVALMVDDLVAQELITEGDADAINDWVADAPEFVDEILRTSLFGGFGGFGFGFGEFDFDRFGHGDDDSGDSTDDSEEDDDA